MTNAHQKGSINRQWYLVDLEGKILGRAASKIAHYLRGKHKPEFAPHLDCGDYIVVINAEKVKVSGKKLDGKIYFKHTGYPGSLTEMTLRKMLETQPKRVIEMAVSGMIRHNRLKKDILSKMKVFVGPNHKHTAQNPKLLELV